MKVSYILFSYFTGYDAKKKKINFVNNSFSVNSTVITHFMGSFLNKAFKILKISKKEPSKYDPFNKSYQKLSVSVKIRVILK